MEEERSTENYNKIYLGAILVLIIGIGVVTYLWTSERKNLSQCENISANNQDTIQEFKKIFTEYQGEITTDLKSDLRRMMDTYDQLIIQDASKADSLNAQNEILQAQLEKIEKLQRSNNFSYSKMLKLREENETLRGIMRGYVVEIDSLNTLNLQKDIIITEQTQTIDERTSQRDIAMEEAAASAEKVKIGSKLSAYNFDSGALKSVVRAKTTTRAKQAVQLQSSFTISGNLIASAGRKGVYMQIIDPNGRTLQNVSSYSTETNEGRISYTEKKEIDYIIKETKTDKDGIEKYRNVNKNRKLKIQNPKTEKLIQKLNIKDVEQVLSFKNPEFTLGVIDEIRTINNFSSVILTSVSRANHVIEELKELSSYDEGHEKQKIDLTKNFEGLKLHMSLNHPQTKIDLDVKESHSIFGNEFRIIQLWSNIVHLIIENCEFNGNPSFQISSNKTNHTTCISIECLPSKINTELFNPDILNHRFFDDVEGSIKLKLNIIQTILIEHKAILKCLTHKDSSLSFAICF